MVSAGISERVDAPVGVEVDREAAGLVLAVVVERQRVDGRVGVGRDLHAEGEELDQVVERDLALGQLAGEHHVGQGGADLDHAGIGARADRELAVDRRAGLAVLGVGRRGGGDDQVDLVERDLAPQGHRVAGVAGVERGRGQRRGRRVVDQLGAGQSEPGRRREGRRQLGDRIEAARHLEREVERERVGEGRAELEAAVGERQRKGQDQSRFARPADRAFELRARGWRHRRRRRSSGSPTGSGSTAPSRRA